MTSNYQNNLGNEFLIQKSIWKEVLHLHRAQTKKVRIFIMTGGGHIWLGNYVISGGVAGKHLGDFSETLFQHYFVNGSVCQVQDYSAVVGSGQLSRLSKRQAAAPATGMLLTPAQRTERGSGCSFLRHARRHIGLQWACFDSTASGAEALNSSSTGPTH